MLPVTLILTLTLSGWVTFYAPATPTSPSMFARVWDYREHHLPACPECIGFAATVDPQYIGRKVWVTYREETVGPLYVIDCAGRQHVARRLAQGDIGELDYWLAVERWGARGRLWVTFSFAPPSAIASNAARAASTRQ